MEPKTPKAAPGNFNNFSARQYLTDYYVGFDQEDEFLLNFYHETYKFLPKQNLLLEFGGGPVIYPLISARNCVSNIIFADYLRKNLEEVRLWTEGSAEAFNWDHLFQYVAKLEKTALDNKCPSTDGSEIAATIERMKNQLRARFSRFISCDAFSETPIAEKLPTPPDVVSVNFCPESICQTKIEFHQAFSNITSLVVPGSYLVFCCLSESYAWFSDKKSFCCYPITPAELRESLEHAGFAIIDFQTAPSAESSDYKGLITSLSQRR